MCGGWGIGLVSEHLQVVRYWSLRLCLQSAIFLPFQIVEIQLSIKVGKTLFCHFFFKMKPKQLNLIF